MSKEIEEAINNLNTSSEKLEASAKHFMDIDDLFSRQLDEMAFSLRQHSNDLGNFIQLLGDI